MASVNAHTLQFRFADKDALLRILDAQEGRTETTARACPTVEEVRKMMIADGIRPEANELSREIIRARYPDED